MRRPLALTAGAVLIWSVQDILIWHTFFEGRPWSQAMDLYQFWHQAFLVLLIVAGALWLRGLWLLFFATATWTLANSGLADVLYYWLNLRPIPETMPWLDSIHPLVVIHPTTSWTAVASSLIWIAAWVAVGLVLGRRETALAKQKGRS